MPWIVKQLKEHQCTMPAGFSRSSPTLGRQRYVGARRINQDITAGDVWKCPGCPIEYTAKIIYDQRDGDFIELTADRMD